MDYVKFVYRPLAARAAEIAYRGRQIVVALPAPTWILF
jgi:hypothetical protein